MLIDRRIFHKWFQTFRFDITFWFSDNCSARISFVRLSY